MKTKTIYAITLILALFTLNLDAQPNEDNLEILTANCYNSLIHDNLGVKESAIYISMQFKNKFPNRNIDEFVEALDKIAEESNSARISYKAQLAKIYIENYDWFEGLEISSIVNEQKIYEEIANKISNKLFAADF